MRGRFRTTKRLLFHGSVRGLQLLATTVPRPLALRVFARLGDLVLRVDRPAVRRSLCHLRLAYGSELSEAERAGIVRDMFRETGRNLVDLLRMPRLGPGEIGSLVEFEGLEHLDEALTRGNGVVALSAHLGNWEILGAALAARGYPVTVVAREIFDSRSDRLLNRWRREWGLEVVSRREGLLPVLQSLRRGAIVGALVDQDTGGRSVFADFFGMAARTPIAPFVLARRTHAPLVPMWIHLDESGRHRARILPGMAPVRARDPREAVRRDVERWHGILEAAIRERPAQWVWHHRRWKTRPGEELSDLRSFSKKEPYLTNRQRSRETVVAR